MKIKALSVKEPFASFIKSGTKKIETRTWKTKYRGDILICASKIPQGENSGMAVCIAELVEIREME